MTNKSYEVYLLSANNNGAGKTTYAKILESTLLDINPNTKICRMPLANCAKEQFKKTTDYIEYFNGIDVFSESFKNHIIKNKSGREFLKDFAEGECKEDPLIWCEEWISTFINQRPKLGAYTFPGCVIIVEDIRKVCELAFFRTKFARCNIFHKHFISEYGQHDADFPDTKIGGILEKLADKVEYIKKE